MITTKSPMRRGNLDLGFGGVVGTAVGGTGGGAMGRVGGKDGSIIN